MAKIYAISPPKVDINVFLPQLQKLLGQGGVAMFQLRLKGVSNADYLNIAQQVQPICKRHKVPFIVNDSLQLALDSAADGLHIGQEDGDIASIRAALPNKILGVSCYDSIELAQKAVNAGADYVSFGAFFDTTTKQTKYRPKADIINKWQQQSNVPCCAIGGINKTNIHQVQHADYVAMVSAMWQ